MFTKNKIMPFLIIIAAALMLFVQTLSAKEEVEVLHWWTSGGEAAALKNLKKSLESKGITWLDSPIAGGGGSNAMTVLRARVSSGKAPTAVQMLGFDIQDWAKEGVLADLNKIAEKENWGKVVPSALQRFSKYKGKWIASPVNVHSTNWMWANKAIFDELKISTPSNWKEFVSAMKKIKAAGYTAIAHGGQPWQEATIFDSIVLSVGGKDFYQKSLIDLDEAALGSEMMKEAFNRMRVIRGFVDDNFSGRDWNLATAMVMNKKAGVQIMGDWAKGEFLKAGKKPGKDFLCTRFPGTSNYVTFNSDQFAMFKVDKARQASQKVMAALVMDKGFQAVFNQAKGSVPARTDVPDTGFDACGIQGMKDLRNANKSGNLLGSMGHGHSTPAAFKNAFYDVITEHFNSDMSAEEAVKSLKEAIANAQ